jgi:hypothetical protein
MSTRWRKFSTTEVISTAFLAGAGKSAEDIAINLRVSVRKVYDMLHRNGIRLVSKGRGEGCVGPIVMKETAIDAGIALAATVKMHPDHAYRVVLEEVIASPSLFREIVARASGGKVVEREEEGVEG